MKPSNNILSLLPKNAGMHNSICRGEDITDLFYDGTLSKQIENGTFDDIFIGDYIIGKESQKKYLVADLDYRLHCGNTECTKHHVLMIPEKNMGTARMNESNTTTGAYIESEMYTKNLESIKTIIRNDFENSHILKYHNYFANAINNGCESKAIWVETDIDLMNEIMVYGCNIHHNSINGTNIAVNNTIDNSQLSLFKLRKDFIIAFGENGGRQLYWLRDVANNNDFANVNDNGSANKYGALYAIGVRPAFLII